MAEVQEEETKEAKEDNHQDTMTTRTTTKVEVIWEIIDKAATKAVTTEEEEDWEWDLKSAMPTEPEALKHTAAGRFTETTDQILDIIIIVE